MHRAAALAEGNGGWDPADLWNVDTAIAEDMLAALKLAKDSQRYPGGSGLRAGNQGNLASLAQRAHIAVDITATGGVGFEDFFDRRRTA